MKDTPKPKAGVTGFGRTAVALSKSPLGIIALFIVLIYGFAALVLGLGGASLGDTTLKLPLVWFLVLFPPLVLGVFAWLVAMHHEKLYAPGDFRDERIWLQLRQTVEATSRKVDILEEVSPVTIAATPSKRADITERKKAINLNPDDPQKGRWGGKSENSHRILSVQPIRPLRSDPDYYRVSLEVRSTEPKDYPLSGKVTFHLHDTFDPDNETVAVRDGVARLEVVAYGAFTVGAKTAEGVMLELDLADPSVDAPEGFKES